MKRRVHGTTARRLARRQLASGGKGPVFGLTRFTLDAAAKRLRDFGAPRTFNWQALRRTCAVYLTNAPGIFHREISGRSVLDALLF